MQHLLEKTRHSPRRNLILLALGGVLTLHVAAAGIDIAQFAAGQRDFTGFIQLAEVIAGFGLGLLARN